MIALKRVNIKCLCMFNVVLEVVLRTLTLLSRSVKDLDVFELDADACPQTQ